MEQSHTSGRSNDGEAMDRWFAWYNSEAGRERREQDEVQRVRLIEKEKQEAEEKEAYLKLFIVKYNLSTVMKDSLREPLDFLLAHKGLCVETLIREVSEIEYRNNLQKESVRKYLQGKE